jgi:hypothetical protein
MMLVIDSFGHQLLYDPAHWGKLTTYSWLALVLLYAELLQRVFAPLKQVSMLCDSLLSKPPLGVVLY